MTTSAQTSGTLDILKQAIMLEKRGHAFYKKVADQAKDAQVQTFFNDLANEEVTHIKLLSDQFKAYNSTGRFKGDLFDDQAQSQVSEVVLNKEMQEKISAAGFEASAIAAAISMEQRAIDLYSKQAGVATDSEEKKVYTWLATFERDHLNSLMAIDRALLDDVWEDNHFWPM